MEKLLSSIASEITAFLSRITGIEDRVSSLVSENRALRDSLEDATIRLKRLEEGVEERLSKLESERGRSVLVRLREEVLVARDAFYRANPSATTLFSIEALPGLTLVFDRTALKPSWTELDSRLRVNHNLTIQASTSNGVGEGGHAHLVFRVNRADGRNQEFQIAAVRDKGTKAYLVGHFVDPSKTDPIHEITRGDVGQAFFSVASDIAAPEKTAIYRVGGFSLNPEASKPLGSG